MSSPSIAVIGLEYVGLPLALALPRNFSVTGDGISGTGNFEPKVSHVRTDEIPSSLRRAISLGLIDGASDIVEAREIMRTTQWSAPKSIQWHKDGLGGKPALDVGRRQIESFEKNCTQP